jgi:predicted acylesterase/phospholipase RssA
MKISLYNPYAFSYASMLSQSKTGQVGLVLSGGGAKGFAHIGVLKCSKRQA